MPQIQDVIGKLESARKLDGKSTGDETTRWLVDSLGEPVHNGEDAVRNQAKALLRYEVDRGNGLRQNPLELVATYRFIFWQPSKTSLLEVIRSLSQKQRQPPELPESTTTQDTPATPDVGRRMAALLGGLERDLRLVNGELWEDMNLLENALKGLANTEGRLDPTWLDPGSARPLGIWKPLRWALSGGIPGPPVWACMVLLGKEETLRRLITASAIAKELDV